MSINETVCMMQKEKFKILFRLRVGEYELLKEEELSFVPPLNMAIFGIDPLHLVGVVDDFAYDMKNDIVNVMLCNPEAYKSPIKTYLRYGWRKKNEYD